MPRFLCTTLTVFMAFGLLACTTPSQPKSSPIPNEKAENTVSSQTSSEQALAAHHEGRISILVNSTPLQRWSAQFSLSGSPNAGRLELYSPFGSTLAGVDWMNNQASLEVSGRKQDYTSVAALLEREFGVDIPLQSLFDWLSGQDSAALGWRTQGVAVGSKDMVLLRDSPLPTVEVKVLLDE